MDNASLILQTLDAHLTRSTRLVLYGRAAPDLTELREAFERAKPAVLEIVRNAWSGP
jgi:hypothetical protein